MARTLEERTHDATVIGEMIVELTEAAIGAGAMTDEVVELVCDLERRVAIALEVTSPDPKPSSAQ